MMTKLEEAAIKVHEIFWFNTDTADYDPHHRR
jgi:hypothetical protein